MKPFVPVAVVAALALALVIRGGCRPAPGPATPTPSASEIALLPPPPTPRETPSVEPVTPETPATVAPASPTPEPSPTEPPPPPPPPPTPEPKTPEEIGAVVTEHLQQGIIALRENRPADALPLLQRAHKLMPRDQRALQHLRRAEAALAAAEVPAEEREAHAKKLAAERDAMLERFRAALTTDIDQAGHILAEARNRFPDDADVRAARPALEAARAARAEKVVRERKQTEWRAHVARGEAAYKAGQLVEARAAYEDALKAVPGDPLATKWIAVIDARTAPPRAVASPRPRASPAARPSPAASPAKKQPPRRKPR